MCCIAQQKWVTFEDMVDDAMEGGKLSPMDMRSDALNLVLQMPRRYSVTGNSDFGSFRNAFRSYTEPSIFSKSTSISPNSSYDSDSNMCSNDIKLDPPPSKECKQRRFMYNSEKISDFSKTFPGHSKKYSSALSNDKQNKRNGVSAGKFSPKFPHDVEFDDLPMKYQSYIPESSQKQTANMKTIQSAINPKEQQYTLTKVMKPEFSEELAVEKLEETSDDKYMAIKSLNVNQEHGYTGWSTTVMGTGPFGWSDDLLNVCTPQTVSLFRINLEGAMFE